MASAGLWVQSHYGVDQNWLNPASEKRLMWFAYPNEGYSTYVSVHLSCVESALMRTVQALGKNIVDGALPVVLGEKVVLLATILSVPNDPSKLFPMGYDLVDRADMPAKLASLGAVWMARLKFCSIHMEDVQHYVVGLNQASHVVWRARTVEESYTAKVRADGSPFSWFRLCRRAYLFDDDSCMLSTKEQTIRKQIYSKLALRLNCDVATYITELALNRHEITATEFYRGCCEGAVTYATLRLLRIAFLIGEFRDGLADFVAHPQCAASAKLMKRTYSRRRRLFGRNLATMVLRSGRVC
jgi:hypothetical protein